MLDTNVLSEARRRPPHAGVAAWLGATPEDTLYLSVLVVGEIAKGIAKLPGGPQRTRLEGWLEAELLPRFAGRLLDLDEETARIWGRLSGEAEVRGAPLPVIDTLLAATALRHDLTLVTRNTRDFNPYTARLLNPWETA